MLYFAALVGFRAKMLDRDIPLLVRYFVDRYAKRAGRKIGGIRKSALDLLESYSWPGNIRELQNVIERSLIVCETDEFSMDCRVQRQSSAFQHLLWNRGFDPSR